jgi:hypothetical protein
MGVSFILIDSPGARSLSATQVIESIRVASVARKLPSLWSQKEDVMETADADVGKMEAELRQWGTRLDNLLAMADLVGTAARIDRRERLDDLKNKYDAAEAKLAALKAAGSGKREIIKGGVENAWSELAMAFTRLAT